MEPLNINKQGCTEQSSNCIVWQGPTLECIGLCKGSTVTQVVYEMATKICSILEQLDVANYDITCLNSVACPPETFSELIQLMIQSICDINAQAGEDGTNGNYTEVEAFAPGENGCENGGVAITTFDGVTTTQINQFFICNPVNGEDGATGAQGPRGDYVQITAASVGQCPTGGIVVQLIDGVTSDVLSENIICNGTNGTNGTDGDDGINGNYVETRVATLGECPAGGAVVTLKDGVTNVTISEDIICNGVDGDSGALTWESLTPYLLNTWFQAGGQPGEYAFDAVKGLLYLRGNLGFTGTPGSSNVFALPDALVGGGTSFSSHTTCYEYTTPAVAEIRIGSIVAFSFTFRYDGGGTNPTLSLDSTPIIRMK